MTEVIEEVTVPEVEEPIVPEAPKTVSLEEHNALQARLEALEAKLAEKDKPEEIEKVEEEIEEVEEELEEKDKILPPEPIKKAKPVKDEAKERKFGSDRWFGNR